MKSSSCCSGTCTNNLCGDGTVCFSDGSACGDCLANTCCTEITACFGSPACLSDLACVFPCLAGGGGPLCLFQCLTDPATLQVVICAGLSCGAGVCF